jgi:SAM-dependent methyltransferase
VSLLKNWLSEPLARGLKLDDPALTEVRKIILWKKKFLRAIYTEWYQMLSRSIPEGPGIILELGSGAGFASEIVPGLLTSEVFWLSDISLVFDGCTLPFPAQSLKAIILSDVLHHIPQVRAFFSEATRCLMPGGVVAMVEPWSTTWSRYDACLFLVVWRAFYAWAAARVCISLGPLAGKPASSMERKPGDVRFHYIAPIGLEKAGAAWRTMANSPG